MAMQNYNSPSVRLASHRARRGKLCFGAGARQGRQRRLHSRCRQVPGLPSRGRIARYFAGITAHDMGDNADAEKALQMVAGSRSKEIASLAKLALAGDLSRQRPRSRPLRFIRSFSHGVGRQRHGAVVAGVVVRRESPA